MQGVHNDGLGAREGLPGRQLPPPLPHLFLEELESLLSESGQAPTAWLVQGLCGATPAVKGGGQQLAVPVFLYAVHLCLGVGRGEWQGIRGRHLTLGEEGQVQHFCVLLY